jgi:site-specific DNA-methyltransferase (adenine-specific)
MDFMAGLPDKAFELAVCDPPYGIGDALVVGGNTRGAKFDQNKNSVKWDIQPSADYFSELERVSKNRIIWGANYFNMPPSRCVLIWDKCQEFTGADFELAWTSFDKAAKAFRLSRVEAYTNGKIHPCQKPVALYEWLLTNYAKPGDRILDTHLGSGSSAIAAHNLGFDFVGMELDPDYYQAAVKRFEQHKAQAKLFDCDDYQLTERDYQQDSLL